MFFGDLSLEGSYWTYPVLYGVGVVSIMCSLLCMGTRSVLFLLFRSLVAYPSFTETICLSITIWGCRNVERILGAKAFRNLMIYSMISYFPIYVLATIVLRFYSHFSLVSFYAYTTFLFSLYHFPAIDIFLVISDKFLITLTFLLAVAVQLPYSLITALCSGLGIWIWRKDFLGLSYFARETVDPNDGQPLNLVQSRIAGTSGETVDMFDSSLPGSIRSIVEMGFSEFQALTALRANNNDVQRAVEHLLIH